MKFKEAEQKQSNPFFDSVNNLIVTVEEFSYALDCYKNSANYYRSNVNEYKSRLGDHLQSLIKLSISLNPEHIEPSFTANCKPAKTIAELKVLEEKYYNELKEVGNNALEANDAEVFSYLGPIIREFKHYFCTINEDDSTL